MRALPRLAQLYICVIVAAALAVLALVPTRSFAWPTLGLLIALLVVAESVATVMPREGVRLSAGFSFTVAAVIIVGPVGAALVGAAGAFAYVRAGSPPVKRAFNGALYALSAFAAGVAYQSVAPGLQGPLGLDDFPWVCVPFAAAVAAHFLTNTLLVAGVIGLAEGAGPLRAWARVLTSWVWPYLGYGTLGLIIAALWASMGLAAAVLLLLPIFVARWAFGQYAAEKDAYDATIAALCQAVETKDYYTRGHCERVARASVLIARKIGMREERVSNLRYAGMLHDVGKLGVPTQVLQKTGPLTEDEYGAVQLHPTRGAEIVQEIEFLGEAQAGIVHHHERLDGRGYPAGLAGRDIPEFARVIGVADAFDSMTSTRAYRAARTPEAAIGELRKHAGTQFDPVMVEALVGAVEEHGWEPHEPAPPDDETAAVPWRDHDDPSAPLPVTGGGVTGGGQPR